MTNTEKLLKIKKQIEESKSKQSEIKGKSDTIESQIKNKFKIKISNIDSELDKKANILDKKELEFQNGVENLIDSYNWDI